MGNHILEERIKRIDFLCKESENFDNWKDFEEFVHAYLFREGLTSEKIEEYQRGLKKICESKYLCKIDGIHVEGNCLPIAPKDD